jgi:hypothetical protein
MSKIILEPMSLCYCLFEIDLKEKYLMIIHNYPCEISTSFFYPKSFAWAWEILELCSPKPKPSSVNHL